MDVSTSTGDPRDDIGVGCYCLRCIPVRNVPNTRRRSVITQDDTTDEEDLEDDEGFQDERDIWEVTHVTEQELETTEGEGVDLLYELLDLVGWPQVNDDETEKDLS